MIGRLALASALLSLGILAFGQPYSAAPAGQQPLAVTSNRQALTPEKYRREPEQTFLTFPEWFLVFSPREYADYVGQRPPTDFPFMGQVAQFWFGYWHSYVSTSRYPFNSSYHLMNWIIGTSTTVEFLVKGAYEETVGRLSALAGSRSDEEQLAAVVAEDYTRFIEVHAWYEYDFFSRLRQLWTETPWFGWNLPRKLERRYFLSTEYLFKGVYGWALNAAARASYEPESPVTAAVVTHLQGLIPGVDRLAALPDGQTLVTLPRYQAFTPCAVELANRGVDFVEIAGNRGAIAVTYLVSRPEAPGGLLFSQPILTRPGMTRLVLQVPVSALGTLLRGRKGEIPEHIFDF